MSEDLEQQLSDAKAALAAKERELKTLTDVERENAVLKTELMQANWGSVYQSLSEARNVEFSVFWTRFEVMAVLNVAVAGAVLGTERGLCLPSPLPFVVGFLGFAVAAAWFVFALKGSFWVTEWNDELARTEKGATWQPQARVVSNGRKGALGEAITWAALLLPGAFALVWALLLTTALLGGIDVSTMCGPNQPPA